MKKGVGFLIAYLLASATLWSTAPDDNRQMVEIECPIRRIDRSRIHPKSKLGVEDTSQAFSTNWSGYVAAPSLDTSVKGSVTYAAGSWLVPSLAATPDSSDCAIWVGIDGFTDGTVEQIGTAHNWIQGVQQNFAWFEMFPMGSFEIIGFPVDIGDQISARVAYKGSNVFKLVIINHTQGVSTDIPCSYTLSCTSERSSAEWIVEAPFSGGVLPLSDFQLVTFNYCWATINGISGSISDGNWVNDEIIMLDSSGNIKALPSDLLKDGTCFRVTWLHE